MSEQETGLGTGLEDLDERDDLDEVEASDLVDDDGEALPEETLDELAAVTEAEASALDEARTGLEAERAQTRAALGRYRAAVLAAEPELPPDLVVGETLEELEASLTAARAAVAGVRARLEAESEAVKSGEEPVRERGFPAGAPARGAASTVGMSAAEKIRTGLEQRALG
ncbi:MAG: hypothetical protein R3C39_03880 [Dehalococcoidia bacterium]